MDGQLCIHPTTTTTTTCQSSRLHFNAPPTCRALTILPEASELEVERRQNKQTRRNSFYVN